MATRLNLNPSTLDGLRLAHDEVRGELVRATREGGAIAVASRRLAELCLPHFEREEKCVLPVLKLLPEISRGILRPEMAEVLPLISDFSSRRERLDDQHSSILAAVDELIQVAHAEKSRECAALGYHLRAHECVEEQVVFPALMLVGQHLRARLLM